MIRARLRAIAAAAAAAVATIAFVRLLVGRDPDQSAERRTEERPRRPLPAFTEIGPDLFKQTTACRDAEIEFGITQLRSQAATKAQAAAREGMATPAGREMTQRAQALEGDADALERYLQSRRS